MAGEAEFDAGPGDPAMVWIGRGAKKALSILACHIAAGAMSPTPIS